MPIDSRSEQVMVRLTPAERHSVEQAAKIKDEKVGTVLREVIIRWAKRVTG